MKKSNLTFFIRIICIAFVIIQLSILNNQSKAQQAPVADFSCAAYSSGDCNVIFTDLSTNNPTSWFWIFGDGNTDTVQNPWHTYPDSLPGTYTVILFVGNAYGVDSAVGMIQVDSSVCECYNYSSAPVADFSCYAYSTGDCMVNFTDLSTNDPSAWFWDFGNGDTDTVQDPNHSYSSISDPPGIYPITLIASNLFGSDTAYGAVLHNPGTYNCQGCDESLMNICDSLSLLITGNDVSCIGNSDGSADLTVTGGAPSYIYLWSNGESTEDISGVLLGIYDVTVTDNNGCTVTDSVTIAEPSALSATITVSINISCFGVCDGSIMVTPFGGTSPYNYLWDDSLAQTGTIATGLCVGTYNVMITDSNGCTFSDSIAINEPSVLSLLTDSLPDTASAGVGMAWVTVSGGTPPYYYLWDDPASQTTETASNLLTGTYNVMVADSNGCTDSSSATVGNITGMSDWAIENNIRIYPNPNPGMFNLAIEGIGGIGEIRVLNILAKEIYKEFVIFDKQILTKNGAYRKEIDLTNQPDGIYILQVHCGLGVITRKVVVNSNKY